MKTLRRMPKQLTAAAGLSALPMAAFAAAHEVLDPAGPQAAHIAGLWTVLLWTCSVFGVLIVAAVAAALWRGTRSTEATPADVAPDGTTEKSSSLVVIIALACSVVALLGLTVTSVATDRALAGLSEADAVALKITAHDWWWEIRYEDAQASRVFTTANELHVPVGRTIVATLESSDVIHSLWVPNLHGKRDLIPGQTATIKFRADKPGAYRGQCAEFCGYQHAKMALLVVAEPAPAFESWAQAQRASAVAPSDALKARGARVFMTSTCAMCHAIQGTAANGKLGPDLTHLAGRRFIAAGTLPNERNSLAAWIADPQRYKPGVNMPAHAFEAPDLQALLAYLESLT
jgi:cytochrome c oxidase subunit 2